MSSDSTAETETASTTKVQQQQHEEKEEEQQGLGAPPLLVDRPLYGGAIRCGIPSDWRDVSEIRQVPDHQECWQEVKEVNGNNNNNNNGNHHHHHHKSSSTGGSVLVFELLARQDHVSDDEAAKFFFQDLAESNGVVVSAETSFSSIPDLPEAMQDILTQQFEQSFVIKGGVGFQKVALGKDTDVAGNSRRHLQIVEWIRVQLCVLRLPTVETDMLIILSQPEVPAHGITANDGDDEDETAATAAAAGAGPQSTTTTPFFSETFQAIVTSLKINDWSLFG